MPEDDTSTSGGAIDEKTRAVFTDLATNDKVEIISSSNSDTMEATVTGRLADGSVASETLTLTGTTAKLFNTNTFERILKVELAEDAVGNVTVRRQGAGATIGVIPAGERGFRRLFINSASDPSSPKTRYEKIFWKNKHASLAFTSAVISQSADPTGVITHALATSKDDTGSVANRLTAPAGLTFDDTDKAVPGGSLGAGQAIGVWLKQSLSAGQSGFKSTYTSQITGNSV
ncbi:MAG: hypothetical protein ACM3S1_07285 [Hyphomicrobiales bacterium]